MARVLAVTRHAVYAIELRRQGFDVVDVQGAQVGQQHAADVDAAVLDLAELEETRRVIDLVRARAKPVPIVVLGPDEPDWLELEHAGDGLTALVVPPVPGAAVAGAIRALVGPAADEPDEGGQAGAAGLEVPVPGATEESELPTVLSAARAGEVDGPPPAQAPPLRQRTRRLERHRAVRRHAADATPVPPPRTPGPDWRRAAEVLLASVPDLPSLAATAYDLSMALAGVACADAVAVLVREGRRLAVAGGFGLRALETRLGLDEQDWMVRQLWDVAPVLVVEDTDRVRAELALAPLASRRRLLAARLAPLDAVVVAGRGGERFGREEVRAVTDLIGRETPRLADALRARDVARALAPLA